MPDIEFVCICSAVLRSLGPYGVFKKVVVTFFACPSFGGDDEKIKHQKVVMSLFACQTFQASENRK